MSVTALIKPPEELLVALLDTFAGMTHDDPDRPALQRQIVDTVTMTLAEFESEAKIAADAERAAKARKQLFERNAEELERAVKDAMEFAGEKELRGQAFTLKLQRTPASVLIVDQDQIPAGFRTIVPQSWTPNKAAIAKALKAGQAVAGADLSEGNMRLVWK